MQIITDGNGINPIDLLNILETFFKEPDGFIILPVADMLARYCKSALCQRKGVLEVRAAAQHFGTVIPERDRLGRIAAGATEKGQFGVGSS